MIPTTASKRNRERHAAPESGRQADVGHETVPTSAPDAPGFMGSAGRPLANDVRTSLEARLGAPLDDAVLHIDARAADIAASVAADAFAVGRHVVFGAGQYDPSSIAGRELLTHELAHVVRASKHARESSPSRFLPKIDNTAEESARALTANGLSVRQTPSEPLAIRRQVWSEAAIRKRLEELNGVINDMAVSPETRRAADEEFSRLQAMLASGRMAAPTNDPKASTSSTASGAREPSAAALTIPPNASLAELVASMQLVDAIVPSQVASGMFTTVYQGRTLNLNAAQVAQIRKTAKDSLTNAVARSKRRVNDAIDRYKAQEATNAEFPATSRAVKAWAWVSTFGNYSNPRESVFGQATTASMAAIAAEIALSSGHFAQAIKLVAKCDEASERTSKLVYAYIDQLLEGGDSLVTGLEFTRNAAFLTVGVLAVVVTGGAALGLEAGVVGTGVGGLTVAQTATAISVGAPIVANLGEAALKMALGDEVDWGKVGVDIAVQVILAKFGGKLGAGIAGKIAGAATQSLARQTIAALASGAATHGMSQAFVTAVDSIYWSLRGRKVTWGDYVEALSKSLASPTGWFMVALGSGAHVAAQVKVTNAVNAPKQLPAALAPKKLPAAPAPQELTNAPAPSEPTSTFAPKEPPLATASKEQPSAAVKEPTTPIPAGRQGRPIVPDDVIDDFIKRLDEPGEPFELDISKRRAAQIASGEKDFALDTPSTFDVDEPLAVGAENIKPGRAVTRALDPHNRQLLDSSTNRATKHVREGTGDVARHRTRLEPVSVKDNPSSIVTRRFDEVTELNQVFKEAVERVGNKSLLAPTKLKAAINSNIRDIIKDGSTPAGAAVRDALHGLGFAYVKGLGFVVVKPGS